MFRVETLIWKPEQLVLHIRILGSFTCYTVHSLTWGLNGLGSGFQV